MYSKRYYERLYWHALNQMGRYISENKPLSATYYSEKCEELRVYLNKHYKPLPA